MRVVIDAMPMRGDSLSIVVEHLLEGWVRTELGDELHIVVGPDPQCAFPDGVTVHSVPFGRSGFLSRLRAQSFLIPKLCREIDADVMLGVLPTTTVTHLPCPRAIIAYDLRYRLRPEHFDWKSLLLRRVSYAIGFRQADATICISERTRKDLLSFKPWLKRRPMRVAHLGADHVDTWPRTEGEAPYAIAFGHYTNKNVDLVLDTWAERHRRGDRSLPLSLIGVSAADRPSLQSRIGELGIDGFVTISPWLPIEEFRSLFASSSLVVFPSDFEGFGLPAAEAMRLGIPVVVSRDPALLEVTAGRATVMEEATPEALVRAVDAAVAVSADQLRDALAYAQRFTWTEFARNTHWLLAEAVTAAQPVPAAKRTRRLVPALATPRRVEHPIRRGSIRWLGAAAAGTLFVTGAGAVSVALVVNHHATPPSSPAVTTTTMTPGKPGSIVHSSTVPTHVSSSVPATTPTTVSTPTTGPGGGSGSSNNGSTGGGTSTTLSVPGVTVPPVTVPSLPPVTIPTLPSLVCSGIATSSLGTVKPCGLAITSTACRCS